MEACLEKTDAYLEEKEPAPVEMANVAVPHEDSNEEAAVETIGALEDKYGDRHLDIRRRRQPKKRTHGDNGSQHNLAAAWGRLTALPFLPRVRDTVVGDQEETVLQKEPLQDEG
jgi:hypothetical protein